jgi:hypothetical protein
MSFSHALLLCIFKLGMIFLFLKAILLFEGVQDQTFPALVTEPQQNLMIMVCFLYLLEIS